MPRTRKPTREEIWERRAAINEKARGARLRLPEGIAEMRHALGLSQAEFAKIFSLTTRQVSEMERGNANPTAATLNRIGKVFGFQIGFVPRETSGAASVRAASKE
ncbi:transcriptional regulator with XRE-family HTH domain [Bradyrhizobium sp. cir1]|uniref:helix-turn-helix domain-containing protein n=1 Tax=Bradyrhizobium sp. cir1 TaxID=1445730 RepID=UPI001606794C|nr:helix-turn-helix transcriptional regulator [Bradyrhizobium sp. cir1]MBB4374122.1 transcriptional regulator with XRE-family HTH domain [Bradyrhizobium sp. cir1]